MYSFVPAAATRDEPLSWTRLLTTALAAVREAPSDEVRNALAMMDSYAAAAPEVFTNLTRGTRDVQEYVALLCGLDSATAVWPLRVRQLLDVPPVELAPGAGTAGGPPRATVGSARGEALVLLYNVALFHIEAGLSFLSRVRADTASAAHRGSGAGGGAVAAPNQNAKLAAQHCRLAVDVLQWADGLHVDLTSPSAVTLRQLHSHIPLDAARGLSTLCGAVAKYIYALSSASTKDKPDVLARLAFDAAQLPLPACVPADSSLQLLPSLLLAAYHYHKATWYCTATKVAEMGDALGHMQYADALLHTCDAQWGLETAHAEQAHASRQWWGRRLIAFFERGGKRSDGRSGGGAAPTRPSRTATGGVDGDEDGSAEEPPAQQPATAYPRLHGLLQCGESRGSESATAVADVVQVFPHLRLLLQNVCLGLSRYERENAVVYFAKVTPVDVVQRNVPDAASASSAPSAEGPVSSAFESRAALFASLPSFTTLQLALAQEEATGQAQQALARVLERVERDEARLGGYVDPPATLQRALDALEALLPPGTPWASADTLLRTAADAIAAANAEFVEVAAAWKEHHDTYIGASYPDHPSVKETQAELDVWGARATAARLRWQALRAPADATSRVDFLAALVPRSRDVQAYLSQCEEACRDARDVLAASADGVRLEQVQACTAAMEAVRLAGADLLTSLAASGSISGTVSATTAAGASTRHRTTPHGEAAAAGDGKGTAVPAPQYATAEAAIETLVQALEEAPMVLEHITSATATLREMQRKAVMTPIGRLYDVTFLAPPSPTDTTGGSSGRTAAKSSKRKRVRTPSPEMQPPARRSRGEASRAPRAPQPQPQPVQRADPASDSDTAPSSVASSQLGEAEEVATAQLGSGATHATVSNSLLRRLRASRASPLGQEGGGGDAGAGAAPAPSPLFATAKGKAAAKRKRR